MKTKSFLFFVLILFTMACSSINNVITPTAPVPSATSQPTHPPTKIFPTPTVAPTTTVTPTQLAPLSKTELLIKKGMWKTVGTTYGGTIVFDKAAGSLLAIPGGFILKFNAIGVDTTLQVSTYMVKSDEALMELADSLYPEAKTKFFARPSFTLTDDWSGQLLENLTYIKAPNLLTKRSNFKISVVDDPRLETLNWLVMQVTCKAYDKDPGDLPKGIKWQQPHTYQLIVLKNPVDLRAICGDRKNGIQSVWANQLSLTKGQTESAMNALMADAVTWMLSPSVEVKGEMVQDAALNETTNFARFITWEGGMAGWQEIPASFYE